MISPLFSAEINQLSSVFSLFIDKIVFILFQFFQNHLRLKKVDLLHKRENSSHWNACH